MAHSLRIQNNALVDSYTPGGIKMLGRIRNRILAFKNPCFESVSSVTGEANPGSSNTIRRHRGNRLLEPWPRWWEPGGLLKQTTFADDRLLDM